MKQNIISNDKMDSKPIIYIACDHAGYDLKQALKPYFSKNNLPLVDVGCTGRDSVDYPDYANLIIEKIKSSPSAKAILICGSGIGMCIAANRSNNIRAAICPDAETATIARRHNDINVLVLGARFIKEEVAQQVIEKFLTTDFDGGRHQNRIDKIS